MEVFRIAKTKYIDDLSGLGAQKVGGRWNKAGTAVLYAAQNRALAVVEFLVHVSLGIVPGKYSLATLQVPDSASQKALQLDDLPKDWRCFPAPPELAELGTEWVKSGSTLLLIVPSAIVPGEHNVVLNPAHADMKNVTIASIEDLDLDRRLLRESLPKP